MNQRPKVTVIGSSNVDYVVRASKYPKVGETIIGSEFTQFMGGKGANQAVAAARLGADVTFITAIGEDSQGSEIKDNLLKENVNVEGIHKDTDESSGIAFINVSDDTNKITVIPGANYKLKPEHIEIQKTAISSADIVLIQMEIPIDTVIKAMEVACEFNIPIILNPAPAQILSEELLGKATYLTPNVTEMQVITGLPLSNQQSIQDGFSLLFNQRVKNIILTRGEEGVLFGSHDEPLLREVQSMKVHPVDTTGAGDTFNGGLAYSLACGNDLEAAIQFANVAAALSVTKHGAQSGMPTLKEVNAFALKQ
ncbi:ribokinase [Alkalihalophilus pseudofirmus OF4]|uniref:Ribokinase n=1 Tax=Alkalihalophilus pseudofirmus (strain ATCC BAA-2126 / JCM 17055 / OF4) TaxID=398511 RepID=D3FZT8_ALKPO|nr:ribokinase [Alkalihalophilus pseudofirmus]ADC49330.1 ribokinase [Alkalihalophilus pseudofirmus OF4]